MRNEKIGRDKESAIRWDTFSVAVQETTLDVLALMAHDIYAKDFANLGLYDQIDCVEQDASIQWLQKHSMETGEAIKRILVKYSSQEDEKLASSLWTEKYAAVFDLDAAIEMIGFDSVVRYAERIARH